MSHYVRASPTRVRRAGTGFSGLSGSGYDKIWKDYFASSNFTYDAQTGISTANSPLTKTAHCGPDLIWHRELYRNGVVDTIMVIDSPTNPYEWRIANNTLEIFGDITEEGDLYLIRYPFTD